MKKARIIFYTLLVLIFFVGILWGRYIVEIAVQNWEYVTLGYSFLITVLTVYYNKSEKGYLIINKYLLFWFKNGHSKWKFLTRFNDLEIRESQEIKNLILNSFKELGLEFTMNKDLNNHWEINLNDEINFKFDLVNNEEGKNLEFRTSKFLVPWNMYESKISEFINLFNLLSSKLKPGRSNYQISLIFEDKNPYFGFFIRHLPREMVTDFNCQFISPKTNSTHVTATKKKIRIDSVQTEDLRKSAIDYLTLSDTMITKN